MNSEKLYSLAETAQAIGFSEQHLRKMCRENRCAHTVKGDRYFFTEGEARALVVHVAAKVMDGTQGNGVPKGKMEKK
jgi:hypothetical protein